MPDDVKVKVTKTSIPEKLRKTVAFFSNINI